MSIQISELQCFPIKGFPGRKIKHCDVSADFGLEGDRSYALLFDDSISGNLSDDYPWQQKKVFFNQNDWKDSFFFSMQWQNDHVFEIDEQNFLRSIDLEKSGDRKDFAAFVFDRLSTMTPHKAAYHPKKEPLHVVGLQTAKTRYPDRFRNHVSILNAASLSELNKILPTPTQMDVFRGNIVLQGLAPWEEFTFEGKKLRCGQLILDFDKPIVRCFNTEINPQDLGNDLPVLKTLAKLHRKAIFGMMANVSIAGNISVGDSVEIIS